MDDLYVMYVSGLRERAARCRELARGTAAADVARALDSVARAYERDVARLLYRIAAVGGTSYLGSC